MTIYFNGFTLIALGACLLLLLIGWLEYKFQEFKQKRNERKKKKHETD